MQVMCKERWQEAARERARLKDPDLMDVLFPEPVWLPRFVSQQELGRLIWDIACLVEYQSSVRRRPPAAWKRTCPHDLARAPWAVLGVRMYLCRGCREAVIAYIHRSIEDKC